MVVFYDETTVSPLPPGILVTISVVTSAIPPELLLTESGEVLSAEDGTALSRVPGTPEKTTVVYTGYTQIGGSIAFSPKAAVPYIAEFTGTQAPKSAVYFYGNAIPGADTIVNVEGFQSPTLSAAGYRDKLLELFPNGRAGSSARAPGGVLYATMSGLAAVLAALDLNQQKILASERLPTCTKGDLDSWAYDFFGPYLLRFSGEDDTTYYSRVLAGLGPRLTLAAIEQVVNQFYVATAALRALEQDENLAYDIAGAFNVSGGFDIYAAPPSMQQLTPVVKVWDAQSNPSLAAVYGIAPPQFVINIGFSGVEGWFLDHSHLDIETFLIDGNAVQTSTTPPDARLGALVNLVKADGTQPLYQTYSTT